METEVAQQAFEVGPLAFGVVLGGSVVLLALALEQLYIFWGLVEGARKLGSEVGKVLYQGDVQAARTVCERSDSPVADIFIAALNKLRHPGVSAQKAAERARQRFTLWMKGRLWMIGTIAALAPFVGLFGTVIGIIRSFGDIANSGTGGFSVVAAGVSEALVATAGGIFIAVIGVILFNFFQNRGNRTITEIRLILDEFLEELNAACTGEPLLSNRPSSSENLPLPRSPSST